MLNYKKLRSDLKMHNNRITCDSVAQRDNVIRKLQDAGYELNHDLCDPDSHYYDDELLTVYIEETSIGLDCGTHFGDMSYESFIRTLMDCRDSAVKNTNNGYAHTYEEKKGSNNMNMFGNIEFGINKDNKIASTLLGVAVKSASGGWRIYDKAKKSITDLGDFKHRFMWWMYQSLVSDLSQRMIFRLTITLMQS